MFYARPEVPKLGLDLVTFEGGPGTGSPGRPTPFWGRLADGRPILVHYRRGWLWVYSGAPGVNPHAARELLLRVQIGPPLHDDILKEQVCDLLGLSIAGVAPTMTDEMFWAAYEQTSILDRSGRTTYWVRDVMMTRAGGQALADEFLNAFPAVQIVELVFEDRKLRIAPRASIAECRRHAVLGLHPRQDLLAKALSATHVPLAIVHTVFDAHLAIVLSTPPMWSDAFVRQMRARHKRSIDVPEHRLRSRLQTQFDTEHQRNLVEAMIAAIERCFSSWVEEVDLTNDRIVDRRETEWYSNDLRTWCAQESDRFLSLRSRINGHDIGLRPCDPPL